MTDVITVSLKLLKLVIILMDLEETKHCQSLGNASTVALLSILINWSLHEVSTMFSIVVGFSIDRHHTVDCPHLHCYSTVCVCVCVSQPVYIMSTFLCWQTCSATSNHKEYIYPRYGTLSIPDHSILSTVVTLGQLSTEFLWCFVFTSVNLLLSAPLIFFVCSPPSDYL